MCVPSAESLKLCKLTSEFLATHILVASAHFADTFSTLSGRTVTFSGGRVVCKAGFPRPRTVMVVYEETYYDDDFNSIRVLRTNFALEGKIRVAYYKQVANKASVDLHTLNARTLPEHQAVLCRLSLPAALAAALPSFSPEQALANIGVSPSPALVAHPALPPVFSSLARFIVSFNTAYVLVKGFVDHAGSKVKDACERIRDELVAAIEAGAAGSADGKEKRAAKLSRLTLMEASAAIEACVFNGVHRKLFFGLVELYRGEEARTHQLLALGGGMGMDELGVRPELVCQPVQAIQHLQQALNGTFAITPLQKLSVLDDANRLLTQCVDAQMAEARVGAPDAAQDFTLAADDMLPFWIFLLLQARLAHLHANLQYMQHFQPATTLLNIQPLKVHLATIQGALQYVDSGRLNGGSAPVEPSSDRVAPMMSNVPGPRRTRSISTIVTNTFSDLSVRDSPSAAAAQHAHPTVRAAAHAATAASTHSTSFSRRGSVRDSTHPTLAAIDSGFEQLQLSQQTAAGGGSASAHPASARQPAPRSELPATRGSLSATHLSRASSLAYPNGTASPAVAAVAASSVERMGDFLASLQKQDDGATGRLGHGAGNMAAQARNTDAATVRPATRTAVPFDAPSQSARRATNPPLSSSNSSSGRPSPYASHSSVLRLDDDDLPPLIVQRTTSSRRH